MSYLWSEKYRPKTVNDCAIPSRLKDYFNGMIEKGVVENMIFAGPPGTGKTTCAKAICEQIGADYIVINASENGNIDTLRTTIRQFASTVSFVSDIKVVILDEADYLNPQSTQPALRGFIEEFSEHCRFIFTANFENKILDALKSRAPVVSFQYDKNDLTEIVPAIGKILKSILATENIQYDKMDVVHIVKRYMPDFRKMINLVQRNSKNGHLSITSDSLGEKALDDLIGILRARAFNDMRKWVVDNLQNDGAMIRRSLYDKISTHIKPSSIPQLVLILAQYDYKEAFVVDKEINTVAMLTEIMSDVEFL